MSRRGKTETRIRAWRPPWNARNVPHALLDIVRGCNISCRTCYNMQAHSTKPKAEVLEEAEFLLRLRRLESIGIIGGEPTLHPDLVEIVRELTARGLDVELCTNGVLLDEPLMAALADAGLGLIAFHIEKSQRRPDLPEDPTDDDVDALREAKVALAARYGIRPGISLTVFPDSLEEFDRALELTLRCEPLVLLMVFLYRDFSRVGRVSGSLAVGFRGESGQGAQSGALVNRDMYQRMLDRFDLAPYAYVGANVDRTDPRWLTYFLAVSGSGPQAVAHSLRPSLLEIVYNRLYRLLRGRFPFTNTPSSRQLRSQILLNAFLGGQLLPNLSFLTRCRRQRQPPRAKRIVFQCPAMNSASGQVVHCMNCPDAVVKNGRLVPVCIADVVYP